jgi:hypothetical protein
MILAESNWFANKLNGKSGVVDVIDLVPKMIFLRVTSPVVVSVYNVIASLTDCPCMLLVITSFVVTIPSDNTVPPPSSSSIKPFILFVSDCEPFVLGIFLYYIIIQYKKII